MERDPVKTILAVECPLSFCDGIAGEWCSVYDDEEDQVKAFHQDRIRAALSPKNQGEAKCRDGCGTDCGGTRPRYWWTAPWHLGTATAGLFFCTQECAAAGKPLHPAADPSTRTESPCTTCGGPFMEPTNFGDQTNGMQRIACPDCPEPETGRPR